MLNSNVSENYITILKLKIIFYQLNCCLRSEEGEYKAEIAIYRKALPYKKLYKSYFQLLLAQPDILLIYLCSKDAMINLGNDNKYFPAQIKSAGLLNTSQHHDNYRIFSVPFKQSVETGGNLLTCAYRTTTRRTLQVVQAVAVTRG
jgi:hypothetical protein